MWRARLDSNQWNSCEVRSLSRGVDSAILSHAPIWPRGWDSNPRAGCVPTHRLSRPGRYDHFGTSRYKKWGISTPHKHLLMAIAFAIFTALTIAVALLFGKDGSQVI